MKAYHLIIIAAAVIAAPTLPLGAAPDSYKLTLWNQFDGGNNERGTKACKIEAFKDGKVVWKNDNFKLLWRPNQDMKTSLSIPLPPLSPGLDSIRISVIEWVKVGGGLAEVEVYKNGKDISGDCKVSVSAVLDNRFTADKLTDKITTSKKKEVGYWLLPDNTAGYIDIKLP